MFSRYTPVLARTFALRVFNGHETEINRHYWSFKVISEYSNFEARAKEASDPATPTALVFRASGPDAGRIPTTVSAWIAASKELENWLRLGALVSALSFFEAYLRQVLRSALMSDPLCRFGASRALDGTALLKANVELPFETDIASITKGDWASRNAAFRKLFGALPTELSSNMGRLEAMRMLRNQFAHGFGRSLAPGAPTQLASAPSSRLSQGRLTRDLGILSEVAAAVDSYLLTNYIGNFELLYFYHDWTKRPVPTAEKPYERHQQFKRALNRDAKVSISAARSRQLIDYYDSIV